MPAPDDFSAFPAYAQSLDRFRSHGTGRFAGPHQPGLAVLHAPGLRSACDFLAVVRGPRGGLVIAMGTLDGAGQHARGICEHIAAGLVRRARREASPASALNRLHLILARWNDDPGRAPLACSALYAVIDFTAGVLRYANADHPRPAAWTRDGHRLTLANTGDALGVSFLPARDRSARNRELTLEERALTLAGIQRMVCFTPGLVQGVGAETDDDGMLLDVLDSAAALPVDEQAAAAMRSAAYRGAAARGDASLIAADLVALRSWTEAAN